MEGPSELRCFSLIRAINFIHVGNQTPHDSVTSQEPHFPLLLAVRIQFQKYFLEGIKSIWAVAVANHSQSTQTICNFFFNYSEDRIFHVAQPRPNLDLSFVYFILFKMNTCLPWNICVTSVNPHCIFLLCHMLSCSILLYLLVNIPQIYFTIFII